MADMERQAAFYLGKEYDLQAGKLASDEPLMYDARDLTTHAVCIGMTGSGKTGLGSILLEEAALDGIPAIVIDPKGDMTNLLLGFPELRPTDFQPWVNEDDARRKDQTVPEFAEGVANLWRKGLSDWGQNGERIRRMQDRTEFLIYTPGSDAGLPISVLQSFRAPQLSWDDDQETLREMIAATVSGLLGLAGVQADPVQSREHILLAHIFEHYWRQGRDLDMATLIEAIQRPPIKKLGVLDVETFYPDKERFGLAMALNKVIASPSFGSWLMGPPLDVASLIHSPQGKPRVSVFYIAHLNQAEREFFVTLLLEQVISWMRQQSGTTSLRCLVYFDEVFGYLPPYPADPPSKQPIMTLMKQARAFGIGMILTTQNPVDLDYKGLTNAGTWFIGKLQTERDKARLLEGLDSVVAEAGTMLDRAYLDRLISSLGQRVFILHNVNWDRPKLFQTRWALNYLRGPLTRQQIRSLMQPIKAQEPISGSVGTAPVTQSDAAALSRSAPAAPPQAEVQAELPAGLDRLQPRVNARVSQYFLPINISEQRVTRQLEQDQPGIEILATHLAYEPYVLGSVSVLFADTKSAGTHEEQMAFAVSADESSRFIAWGEQQLTELNLKDLTVEPAEGALFGSLSTSLTTTAPYASFRDSLEDYVYRQGTITTWVNEALKLTASVGESEREFAVRCQEEARRQRDKELEATKLKLDKDLLRLQTQLEREERELDQDKTEWEGRKRDELLSAGESLLGMFMGRKRTSALSKASRQRRMTAQSRADMTESEQSISKLKEQIAGMEESQETALKAVQDKWAEIALAIKESVQRPRKSDIRMDAFGLAWVPVWYLTYRDARGSMRDTTFPAYPLTFKQ